MTALYGFCAVVGGVLALVMLMGIGGTEADLDADLDLDLDADLDADLDIGDGAASGAGSALASIFSFRTIVFALAFFGITGLVMPLAGLGEVATFAAAVGVGGLAGYSNHRLIRYLMSTSGGSGITAGSLAGSLGRVSVPVGGGRRGKVVVEVDGRTVAMVAEPFRDLRDSLVRDTEVVVVEVKDGVARVAPMDVLE